MELVSLFPVSGSSSSITMRAFLHCSGGTCPNCTKQPNPRVSSTGLCLPLPQRRPSFALCHLVRAAGNATQVYVPSIFSSSSCSVLMNICCVLKTWIYSHYSHRVHFQTIPECLTVQGCDWFPIRLNLSGHILMSGGKHISSGGVWFNSFRVFYLLQMWQK